MGKPLNYFMGQTKLASIVWKDCSRWRIKKSLEEISPGGKGTNQVTVAIVFMIDNGGLPLGVGVNNKSSGWTLETFRRKKTKQTNIHISILPWSVSLCYKNIMNI